MAAKLSQPRTSIVDLPEEDRELSADELPLIVGGDSTGCEDDEKNTGNIDCDARRLN